MTIEERCKWAHAFILIYDITDRYSFNELTRLKFNVSHNHMRVKTNRAHPCCALVANKQDLAVHEQIVSSEQGNKLATHMKCSIFQEISVKYSNKEVQQLFGDLWRLFTMDEGSPEICKHACHGNVVSYRAQSNKISVKVTKHVKKLSSTANTSGLYPVLPEKKQPFSKIRTTKSRPSVSLGNLMPLHYMNRRKNDGCFLNYCKPIHQFFNRYQNTSFKKRSAESFLFHRKSVVKHDKQRLLRTKSVGEPTSSKQN